ncbi:UNVERIFIED_CONTAM: hypothetical protein K2H54_045858 [Gekko kuhli]
MTAGCTFEEDGDLNQCEYSQGVEDDFEWELVQSYVMPHLTSDLPHAINWRLEMITQPKESSSSHPVHRRRLDGVKDVI